MWYKQEGELVPFTAWPWLRTITQLSSLFKFDYKQLYAYFDKDYGWFYWDTEAMGGLAKWTYETYKDSIEKIYLPFTQTAHSLEELYLLTYDENWHDLTTKNLLEKYNRIWAAHTKMWSASLFIDSFDPGFDQQQIKKISLRYSLKNEEINILTTPEELTYASERRLAFLSMISDSNFKLALNDPFVKGHIKKYDYYQYSYAYAKHITEHQIKEEIITAMATKNEIKKELEILQTSSQRHRQKIKEILKKHQLQKNPLFFFQLLMLWREQRKKVNMMGCYMLHRFLETLETKTACPKKCLEYLNYDEIEDILAKRMNIKTLEERYQRTTLIFLNSSHYEIFVGNEAMEKRKVLEKEIKLPSDQQIRGTAACLGKVQGRVKLIMNREDFTAFKEGDVLVAGMTRPEHIPLMKKASAIITNEGGITCHAAIVSRELKIPCIIGTKIATEVLKDGDFIEVDANKGIVRKLS